MEKILFRQMLIASFAAFLPLLSGAQEATDYPKCQPFDKSFFTPTSPDVWSMVKYGDAETNLYTGTLGLSIPIYEYKDMAFHLPLSIQYASSGYKPNIQAGLVGLGWYLNVGGAITREVKGIPDESTQSIYCWILGGSPYTTEPVQELRGFEYTCNERNLSLDYSYWGMISNDYIATYIHLNPAGEGTYPDVCYETEPDIFHFNFMGYSGSFVRQSNGEFVVYNTNKADGEFRVEGSCRSGFTIVTGDGYRYSFGDDTICETAICYTEGQSDNGDSYSSSWSLTDVLTPDGAHLWFEYSTLQNDSRADLNYSWSCNPRVHREVKYDRKVASVAHSYLDINYPDNNAMLHDFVVNATEIHPIKTIHINDACEFRFEYDIRNGERWDNTYLISDPGYNSPQMRILKSIAVINTIDQASDTLRTCRLKYRAIGGNNPVTVLSDVTLSGIGSYSMTYYNEGAAFPAINTFGIDWWGYYNDPIASPSDFEPTLTTTAGMKHLSPSYSQRNANAEYAKYGMLQEITYPTGGRSVFSYEGNTYSASVNRNHETGYIPSLQNQTGTAGGVRISKIIDYKDEHDSGVCRSFSYTKTDGSSSGTLLWGRPAVYTQYRLYVTFGFSNVEREMLSTQHSFPYSMNNHIEYERIVETRYAMNDPLKKTITEYFYKTYKRNGDTEDLFPTGQVPDGIPIVAEGTAPAINNMLLSPLSKSALRGKLARKVYYADQLAPAYKLYEEEYDYKSTSTEYISIPKLALYLLYYERLNIENPQLKSVYRQYYQNGVPTFGSSTTYRYNSRGQLQATTVTNSKNQAITTAYVYSHEVADPSDAEQTLVANNIVNVPVDRITMYADSTRVLSAEKAIYFRPFPTKDIAKVNRLQTALIAPTTNLNTITYQDQETYDRYDTEGHPLQSTDKSGMRTSYVWGYGGQYIVARVENSTFDLLKPLLPSTLETAPLPGALTPTQENALRALPGVHVTTYMYKPLVGVTRITDPSNRITTYEYDADGKLIRVRDDAGRSVNEYQYNIVNQ